MNIRNTFLITIILAASLLSACGGNESTNTTTNNGPANANSAKENIGKTNSNNPLAVTTPTPDQITNAAPTLGPVYKAFCAAVVRKDDAAIRKFYDSDTLADFEKTMKEEGIKSLSEFLKDDKITNDVCEASNERIKGDKGVAKLKSLSCPNGCDILFVKENGEWKISNVTPEVGLK